MATFLKNILVFLCIVFYCNVLLSKTGPNQKSTGNGGAFVKMALGGVGMGVSAGIMLHSFFGFGDNYLIAADKKAFSRFNQRLVGNYYSPCITESAAFTLAAPFTAALIFPYFLSVFQQGYQAYYNKDEIAQETKSKTKILMSHALECCKIGVSCINFLPLLSELSDVLTFDDEGCWNPQNKGLSTLFALSAAALSCDTIIDSIRRLRNKPSVLKNTQQKRALTKIWLLTKIAAGCTGVIYGAEGMYQSVMNEMFKKHGLLYSIPALGVTTAYMLISGNLAYNGWSKI